MKKGLNQDDVRSGDGAYKCVVTAVHGTSPGLASTISYDAETFDEPVFIKLSSAQPANKRPSETHKIEAAVVGTLGWIIRRNGETKLQLIEGIYVGTCAEAGA